MEMGCTTREKHIRPPRRTRSVNHHFDSCFHLDRASSIPKSILESGLKPLNYHPGLGDQVQNPNSSSSSNPNPKLDDSGWGYCIEEQLEEILLKNLEFLHNEAMSKLVSLGYDEDIALNAILRNGHRYGNMDVLTNILHNSLAYLNSTCNDCGSSGAHENHSNVNLDESEPIFTDLRQLEECSLAGMVCLLQQVRPQLSKGDAMWCLLMSDLHVGRASTMEIPIFPPIPSDFNLASVASISGVENVGNHTLSAIAPTLCKFHGGWGFGNGGSSDFPVERLCSHANEGNLQRDFEFPKRFNLSPSMKSLLKRNVAFFAAGFRANSRQFQTTQTTPCLNYMPSGVSSKEVATTEKCEDAQNSKNSNLVNSVLSKFHDLNLDENMEFAGDDQKDEVILTLLHQIKELERQVKERKEWAQEKAMQAATKLSQDLKALKILRMEREETQRMKKGKQTLEDTTMKRLLEMENALRKASGQVDRANAVVRRLETENAEIRAEMEASKLSAAESVTTCLEVAKREKKCLKRLLAWEKQKSKLQQEIVEERRKISEQQQWLAEIKQAQKEAQANWKNEVDAKEQALTHIEEERRLKESTETSNKRKLEALRLKIEVDFQRHKDDLQRLEQELSRLKASSQSTDSLPLPNNNDNNNPPNDGEETIAKLLRELDNLEDSSEEVINHDRDCIVCMKHEVSVVFLPCAHQVMCAICSEDYGKKSKASCPCCRVPIEQRIWVFGASS